MALSKFNDQKTVDMLWRGLERSSITKKQRVARIANIDVRLANNNRRLHPFMLRRDKILSSIDQIKNENEELMREKQQHKNILRNMGK